MCRSCYDRYTQGTPPAMTPRMAETAELIAHLYSFPWGSSGGPLHVTLDDMNLDDTQFDSDHRRMLVGHGNGRGTVTCDYDLSGLYPDLLDEDWELCLAIFDRLAEMSIPERAQTVWRAIPW